MAEDLYAWMADGTENGIVAVMGKLGPTPLVMKQRALAEDMRPLVEAIATESGATCRLVRFAAAEELEVIARG